MNEAELEANTQLTGGFVVQVREDRRGEGKKGKGRKLRFGPRQNGHCHWTARVIEGRPRMPPAMESLAVSGLLWTSAANSFTTNEVSYTPALQTDLCENHMDIVFNELASQTIF